MVKRKAAFQFSAEMLPKCELQANAPYFLLALPLTGIRLISVDLVL